MNYYKEVKSAFDDWATTYESDVVPKLDLRGYSYNELAKTILSYYDKSMDKKSILELGAGHSSLKNCRVFSQRWNVYTCGFDSKYEDIS